MFNKILIANRGEIACRIIRTARRLGILTTAVYSDADRNALHVSMADDAVHIGPSAASESYLLIEKIIAAAQKTQAQAIHPGYGFLSENTHLAQACNDNGIVFIGPSSQAIEAMGSKASAKNIMLNAGVPLVPGYHDADQQPETLKSAAQSIGYPVLLKASAGGGGKGMRIVNSDDEFDTALIAAKREALSSFGDDRMLIEKYLSTSRHVEVQILCDSHGNSVYLADRDCSLQRRYQKIIEEAPAPNLPNNVRKKMGQAAIKAAKAIDYQGVGTIEFLLDTSPADQDNHTFYFMEMNTRLQVEHPVTEMITGMDLVEWQLRVANSERLSFTQSDIRVTGHAFEARIYAEDCDNHFLPTSGTITRLEQPLQSPQLRIDTGVVCGDEVSVYYDPMIAKLVCWGDNRQQALAQLASALTSYRIGGITHNIAFLYSLATHPSFQRAKLATHFIQTEEQSLFYQSDERTRQCLAIAALCLTLDNALNFSQHNVRQANTSSTAIANKDLDSPWSKIGSWRLNQKNISLLTIEFHQQQYTISVESVSTFGQQQFVVDVMDTLVNISLEKQEKNTGSEAGSHFTINLDGRRLCFQLQHDGSAASHQNNAQAYTVFMDTGAFHFFGIADGGDQQNERESQHGLLAPMNGTILECLVRVDTVVKKGTPLIIMEAMKMEHTILAPNEGKVTDFHFDAGDMVQGGSALLAFEASETSL